MGWGLATTFFVIFQRGLIPQNHQQDSHGEANITYFEAKFCDLQNPSIIQDASEIQNNCENTSADIIQMLGMVPVCSKQQQDCRC